jgi:hypothetical protein
MTHRGATPHAYLSSIRDLTTADGDEILRKKREQQAALAETLRQQIEEKERRKMKPSPHFTFGREQQHQPSGLGLPEAELVPVVTVAGEPRRAPTKAVRKQLFSKADLSQLDLFAKADCVSRPPIAISTESPLLASNVPTPPPGFSMRGLSIVEPVARMQEYKTEGKQRARSTMASLPEPPGTKLGAKSELIYPDGHRSPLSSPRC